MIISIYDINGMPTDRKISLDISIFNLKLHKHIIYLEIKRYLSSQRHGTHKTKERSELSGSKRKIHKQKGTGQSRKGDISNPLFRGGARIFGPRPKNYEHKLNKSVKNLAQKSILSQKLKEHSLKIIEDLNLNLIFDTPNTKNFIRILHSFKIINNKTLFILAKANKNFYLSSRNLKTKKVITINELNNYELINNSLLFFFESSIRLI